jgi:hypothetical protein
VSTAPTARTVPGRAAVPRAGDSAATRSRLERAADGLLYASESDYPFEYVYLAGPFSGPLTVELFRAAAGVPEGVPVEATSLDAFFARHVERADPNDAAAQSLVPRYRRLETTLRTALHDTRVFRVGEVLIRCYVVGTDSAGNAVGLATWAVET